MKSGISLILFTFGLIFALGSSQSLGPPRDEEGKIICNPDDAFCEKLKQIMDNPGSTRFQRNFNDFGALKANGFGGIYPQRCDSQWAKQLCEKSGRICYTNGKCGDLVNEENNKIGDQPLFLE